MPRRVKILTISLGWFLVALVGSSSAYGAGAFSNEILDNALQTGFNSSMDLDSHGEPHILYHDVSSDRLYYSYRRAGVWYREYIRRDAGRYCALALDANDGVHIVFYAEPPIGSASVSYGYRREGNWTFSVVDDASGHGSWCDIAMDSKGTPHISYRDSRNGDLWYAKPARIGWTKTLVDSFGLCGMMSAITVDTQDHPRIAHHDEKSQSLRQSWFDGSSWNSVVVLDGSAAYGLWPDIRVDYQGTVHISHYSDPLVGPSSLFYSKRVSSWVHTTVDTGPVDGAGTSIFLDGFRHPHIAYSLGGAGGELGYARFDGTNWHLVEVSSSFAGANFPSFQRTNEGAIYIAYQQASSENLAFAASEWVDATPIGLDLPGVSTGVAWPDADNDGHLDIFVDQSGAANRLTIGTGWGSFSELPSVALNSSASNYGVAWADYDNDGDQDALITNAAGAVQLVRNEGSGNFSDVTAGDLLSATGAVSVDWVDFDRDGLLDLHLCRSSNTNLLLRNTGGDSFVDVTPIALAVSPSFGAVWADFDQDGWPDVYVTVRSTGNLLFQNTGTGFVDVTSATVDGPGSSRGAVVGDYDNDGRLDIYLVNDGHANELLHNEGGFVFSNDSQPPVNNTDYGYDADWADVDNDGDLDLYLSNYIGENKLFRNDGGSFSDITHSTLALGDGSRGMGFGDMDEDGDLDLYVADSAGGNALIQNIASNGNHWLQLDLHGTLSNASAIGARVLFHTASGTQTREVGASTAYLSQSSKTLEFGLGSDTGVELIEVLWPSGSYQTVSPSGVDRRISVVESTPGNDSAFRGMSLSLDSDIILGLDFDSQLQLELSDAVPITGDVIALTQGPDAQTSYALMDFDGFFGVATIDPVQGLLTDLISFSYPYAPWASYVEARGIAYDPLEGKLYTALRLYFGQSPIYALGRVDLETGWVKNLTPYTAVGATLGSEGLLAIAFNKSGRLFGVSQIFPNDLLQLWELNRQTMELIHWDETADDFPYCYDASFIGDEFWVVTNEGEGICNWVDLGGGGDYATTLATANFIDRLGGLAQRTCSGTQGFLIAEDVPSDPGNQIDLDWSSYSTTVQVNGFEVLRARDACSLLDPNRLPYGSLGAGASSFRDSDANSYESFHYGIRVFGIGGEIIDVLTAPPVFSFPNVLINEFAPAGGVQKGMGKKVGEFVEIFNDTGAPLDLNGYRLSNGPGAPTPDEEPLPATVVGVGGYYSHILTLIDLPDAGGELSLLPPSATGSAVDIVAYGTMGGAPTVPAGFTVSRVEGTSAATPDEDSFEASTSTSGEPNNVPTPDLGNSLVVNEVYYEGTLGNDFVELVNPLGSSLNLDRIVISDGIAFLDTLDLDGLLAPGELTVFGAGGLPWVRDLSSQQLYLYKLTSTNQLQRVDQLGWAGGPTPEDPENALQRVPDGKAVYLGDSGTNWIECGGDASLLYGVPSPGLPNTTSSQTVVIVDIGGGGDYTNINNALEAEGPNTVIMVMPGTYSESFSLEDSTEIVGQVSGNNRPIILGDGSGNPAVTATGVNASAKLSSVSIRGVSGTNGPALMISNASPTLKQIVFEENSASVAGGAVWLNGGAPFFEGCSFIGNEAVNSGGAVQIVSGTPLFTRCLFVLNEAGGQGGAIFAQGGSSFLDRCIVDRNGSWDNNSGVVHCAGGLIDLNLSAVTFSLSGSGIGASGSGLVQFSCGSLHGNPENTPSSPTLVVSDEVFGDPLYCEPLAMGYALQDASPLANKSLNSCNEMIGITGPPCLKVVTDTPSAGVMVNRLHHPYPNPFNPRTQLRFETARAGSVELSLYDQRGRKVADLLGARDLPAGQHSVIWEGQDQRGSQVASGVYFAQLKLDGLSVGQPQRLVLLK